MFQNFSHSKIVSATVDFGASLRSNGVRIISPDEMCLHPHLSSPLSGYDALTRTHTHTHTHTLVIVWQRMGAEQKCPSSHNNPDDAPHTYSVFMYHLTPFRGSAAIVMLECLIQPHQETISDTSAQRPLNPSIHC